MMLIEASKEKWCEAEVHRMAGQIALKSPEPNAAKAQSYFECALAVARAQQAKSWELRAAMSMARHWRDHGKPRQARVGPLRRRHSHTLISGLEIDHTGTDFLDHARKVGAENCGQIRAYRQATSDLHVDLVYGRGRDANENRARLHIRPTICFEKLDMHGIHFSPTLITTVAPPLHFFQLLTRGCNARAGQ